MIANLEGSARLFNLAPYIHMYADIHTGGYHPSDPIEGMII
jgi:hypothetical protein